jgi:hypothetical protein
MFNWLKNLFGKTSLEQTKAKVVQASGAKALAWFKVVSKTTVSSIERSHPHTHFGGQTHSHSHGHDGGSSYSNSHDHSSSSYDYVSSYDSGGG